MNGSFFYVKQKWNAAKGSFIFLKAELIPMRKITPLFFVFVKKC